MTLKKLLFLPSKEKYSDEDYKRFHRREREIKPTTYHLYQDCPMKIASTRIEVYDELWQLVFPELNCCKRCEKRAMR